MAGHPRPERSAGPVIIRTAASRPRGAGVARGGGGRAWQPEEDRQADRIRAFRYYQATGDDSELRAVYRDLILHPSLRGEL